MADRAGQLPYPAKDLVVRYGLMGALQQVHALGTDSYAFGKTWKACMAEGEQAVATGSAETHGSGQEVAASSQPPCPGSLTALPVDRSQIMGVGPLGHLNPPATPSPPTTSTSCCRATRHSRSPAWTWSHRPMDGW